MMVFDKIRRCMDCGHFAIRCCVRPPHAGICENFKACTDLEANAARFIADYIDNDINISQEEFERQYNIQPAFELPFLKALFEKRPLSGRERIQVIPMSEMVPQL